MPTTVRWYGPAYARMIRGVMRSRLLNAGHFAVRQIKQNIGTQGPPRSKPGEYPHRDTGELQKSVHMQFRRRELSVWIIASAPYAGTVETRRSYLRRTLMEIRPQLQTMLLGNGKSSPLP